jgi:hypothetical protein
VTQQRLRVLDAGLTDDVIAVGVPQQVRVDVRADPGPPADALRSVSGIRLRFFHGSRHRCAHSTNSPSSSVALILATIGSRSTVSSVEVSARRPTPRAVGAFGGVRVDTAGRPAVDEERVDGVVEGTGTSGL